MKLAAFITLLPLLAFGQFGFNAPPDGRSVGVADWKTSLVGYWPLDSLNQGKAIDASGGGNVGTNSGAVISAGAISGAASFDGISQTVTASPSCNSNIFTVACWIKSTASSAENFKIGISYGDGTRGTVWMGLFLTSGLLTVSDSDGSSDLKSSMAMPIGWNHLVGVVSNSMFYGYTNGVLLASINTAVARKTNRLVFGNYSSGNFYFPGSIDDVRIYNRALTSNEISAIYRWGWGTHQGTPTHP